MRKVLLVDDNIENEYSIKYILNQDFELINAVTNNETISKIRTQYKFLSAIIISLNNVKTIFELIKIIRDNTLLNSIPLFIVVEEDDDITPKKALKLGANGYFRKPFDKEIILSLIINEIKLKENSSYINTIHKTDKQTGLLNKEYFYIESMELISKHNSGYFTMICVNVEKFKLYNDQYGMDKADSIIIHIADSLKALSKYDETIICRFHADRFAILIPTNIVNSSYLDKVIEIASKPHTLNKNIRLKIGRYLINDLIIPVSVMLDRAIIAQESIKDEYNKYIADYNDDMIKGILKEQHIVNNMVDALSNHEFVVFIQPQYNHTTKSLIGGEALVRWKKGDSFIPPNDFIPVFERNGFIYEMDKYIWEEVCKILRKWIDEKRDPLPISINISRIDFFKDNLVVVLKEIIDKYQIPYEMIRLEVTESAFSEKTGLIIKTVNELIDLGFTIEIDDFGSGYSSLNTLKDVKAQILKLDMKFFEKTEYTDREGNIIEAVVRMAKWLGMAIIAEGVETDEYADFLKSIGCYYIQGYLYSKPLPVTDYEVLLQGKNKEVKLTRLETLKNLDHNNFWDPKSMDTLIFNSYVGGACIFEYHNGILELLRTNDRFEEELKVFENDNQILDNKKPIPFYDEDDRKTLFNNIYKAIDERKESLCEIKIINEKNKEINYIRTTIRMIAYNGDRYLFYCVVVNVSEQRNAEKKEKQISERIHAIMDNTKSGITAVVVNEDKSISTIFVNDRFYELLGYTKKQYKAEVKKPFDRIIKEDYDKTLKELDKLKTIGKTASITMRALKRDGKMVWLRDDVSIIKLADVDGLVQLSNFIDISEQAIAEEQEHRMYEQLEAIMNNMDGGVTATIIENGKTKHILANDKYYEQLGYTKKEYDENVHDSFEPIVEKQREEIRNYFTTLPEDAKSYSYEFQIKKKDGEIRWIHVNGTILSLIGVDKKVHLGVYTDITKIRTLERNEQDLSTQIKSIMNNANAGITLYELNNDDVVISFANDYFYEIMGYTKDEFDLNVNNLYDLIYEDDQEKVEKALNKIIIQKKPNSYEYRIKKHDGSLAWVVSHSSLINLSNYSKTTILSVTSDITELRQSEIKEKETADKLQTIMKYAGNGITAMVINDDKTEFILANDKFYELIGYTKEEYRNDNLRSIMAIIHPDDQKTVYEETKNAIKNKSNISIEYRVIRKDNKVIWLRTVMTITSLEGINYPVQIAIFSDITAEKEAIQRQKQLLDNMPCGAALYEYNGKDLKVIHINKKYWELVNRESVDYTNASVFNVIHKNDRESVFNEIGAAIRQNRIAQVDCRILTNDNSYKAFHISANIEKSDNGKHLLYVSYTPITSSTMSIQEMIPFIISTMMETSSDTSFVKDKDLHYICASKALARELKYDNERDIIGKTDYDLFSKESADVFSKNDNNVLTTGKSLINIEEKIKQNDGTYIIKLTSKYPIIDPVGNIIGIYGISRDITNQVEKELQLELLNSTIPGGIASFLLTKESIKTLYFNEGFYKFSGYTKEEYIEITKDDPLALVFEEDKHNIERIIQTIRANVNEDDIMSYNYRCHTKDDG